MDEALNKAPTESLTKKYPTSVRIDPFYYVNCNNISDDCSTAIKAKFLEATV